MLVTQDLVLNNYFRELTVLGEDFLPLNGPVVLAPTHRSRWDALILPMAAGRRRTNRDCRFMVTVSEMSGLQGWFLNRLGCFPVNQAKPALASLRYSVDLLIGGHQLVVFPEGKINRNGQEIRVEPGLVRLSQLAFRKGVEVKVIPIGIAYSTILPKPFGSAAICFGEPLNISETGKLAASAFNKQLEKKMDLAEKAALKSVGRLH